MTRKQKSKQSSEAPPSLSKRSRRKIDDALKTKIVLESLKDQEPLSVLASRNEFHPNRIGQWPSNFLAMHK